MRSILLVVSFLLIQGCAFTDATLEVSHDATYTPGGPLSDVDPMVFVLEQLEDARGDRERIGYKKNGFGQNTADITTDKPVTEIVSDAIAHALESSGHSLGDGPVSISGAVKRFWFETDQNFWSVEFIGNVSADLIFTNRQTKKVIYEATYQGNFSEKKGGGFTKTWTEVMTKAINSLVEELVLDEELAEALDSR